MCLRWHCGLEIMASIETVVQNADVEMPDDSKPDSTAEVKEEPGTSPPIHSKFRLINSTEFLSPFSQQTLKRDDSYLVFTFYKNRRIF